MENRKRKKHVPDSIRTIIGRCDPEQPSESMVSTVEEPYGNEQRVRRMKSATLADDEQDTDTRV